MINKYVFPLQTLGDNTSPSYYATSIPTRIPTETVPFYYRVREGERLDTISFKFYNTANNWWVIAKANNLANGTIGVPAGTVLRIPTI